MNENAVLQVDALTFAYPERAVLSQWSVSLPAGVTLVRGDESSGKTTVLRLLAGDLVPQSGRVLLHGQLMGAPSTRGGHGATGEPLVSVFWVDPRSVAMDALSARQWLDTLPARYPQWDATALDCHITGFTLAEHLDKPLYALSTGSKRKVFMAGALASGAPLTLMDEPLAGLDKPSVRYLVGALQALANPPVCSGPAARCVLVAHFEDLPGLTCTRTIELTAPANGRP